MDAFVGAHFATWQTMWQRCSVGVEPLKHFSSLLHYPPPEISVSPASVALGRSRPVFVSGGPPHNPLRFITPERLVEPFKRCDVLLGQQRTDGQTIAPGDGFCWANGTGSKWFGFEDIFLFVLVLANKMTFLCCFMSAFVYFLSILCSSIPLSFVASSVVPPPQSSFFLFCHVPSFSATGFVLHLSAVHFNDALNISDYIN